MCVHAHVCMCVPCDLVGFYVSVHTMLVCVCVCVHADGDKDLVTRLCQGLHNTKLFPSG